MRGKSTSFSPDFTDLTRLRKWLNPTIKQYNVFDKILENVLKWATPTLSWGLPNFANVFARYQNIFGKCLTLVYACMTTRYWTTTSSSHLLHVTHAKYIFKESPVPHRNHREFRLTSKIPGMNEVPGRVQETPFVGFPLFLILPNVEWIPKLRLIPDEIAATVTLSKFPANVYMKRWNPWTTPTNVRSTSYLRYPTQPITSIQNFRNLFVNKRCTQNQITSSYNSVFFRSIINNLSFLLCTFVNKVVIGISMWNT